jgi:hypothetical protein
VIATTHHLLENKWKSVLEAKPKAMGTKVESMDFKMESTPNSLLHIKELLLKNVDNGVKTWLGYSKGLSHFIFIGPLHLNMLLKLNDTFILTI